MRACLDRRIQISITSRLVRRLVLGFALVGGCHSATGTNPATSLEEIGTRLGRLRTDGHIQAISAVIARDQSIVWSVSFGGSDAVALVSWPIVQIEAIGRMTSGPPNAGDNRRARKYDEKSPADGESGFIPSHEHDAELADVYAERKLLHMSKPLPPNTWRAVASEGDRRADLAGFTVTETRRQASVLPPHAHEHTNLGLCVSGMFEETLGGRRLTVNPATLIVRPGGEVHANRYGSTPAHCLIIELRPETVAPLKDATDLLDQSSVTEAAFVTATAHRIRAELQRRDEVTPLALQALIYELVAEAHRGRRGRFRDRRRAPWLDRTAELLRESIRAPGPERIGLAEAAELVDVHPCHLARAFRREFGCSVGEYVRLHRLEEAARLLRTSTQALSSVALATGFADQSHFTNAFRRRFGTTPAQFRRLAAGN